MQQHPIPQNVTGYEFHLIGQMTLKQFLEVAAGVVVAVLINITNLPQIVKFPLMILAALTGAAIAFVPLEGRPLDRWFFAFIKSIYQPTMFFWKKTNAIPRAFDFTPLATTQTGPRVNYTPLRQKRVQEFLTTIKQTPTTPTQTEEDLAVQNVLALFNSPLPPPVSSLPPSPPPIVSQAIPVTLELQTPTPQSQVVFTAPSAPKVEIPPAPGPIVVDKNTVPPLVSPSPGSITSQQNLTEIFSQSTMQPPTPPLPTTIAQTAKNLPFPSKPKEPNIIVGMVVTYDSKIVDNAIVTILKKTDSTPVRALKTNTLGQFFVSTPLESGDYILTIEKDSLSFNHVSLSLSGSILEPLFIQAKA